MNRREALQAGLGLAVGASIAKGAPLVPVDVSAMKQKLAGDRLRYRRCMAAGLTPRQVRRLEGNE